jgi:hypothetical protein
LWLPSTSALPPSGMIPPPFFAMMFLKHPAHPSLDARPYPAPASGRGFSILLYISSLPLVTTVVEASKKKSQGSAGMAQAMGLEPSMASRPKVGTMMASELVKEKPMTPRRTQALRNTRQYRSGWNCAR